MSLDVANSCQEGGNEGGSLCARLGATWKIATPPFVQNTPKVHKARPTPLRVMAVSSSCSSNSRASEQKYFMLTTTMSCGNDQQWLEPFTLQPHPQAHSATRRSGPLTKMTNTKIIHEPRSGAAELRWGLAHHALKVKHCGVGRSHGMPCGRRL